MQGDQRVGECSVVVKVTRLCNLRCSYCHDWRDGAGQTMTFGVLARVIAGVLGDPEHALIPRVEDGLDAGGDVADGCAVALRDFR